MRSVATTVDGYLAELEPERRSIVAAVRDLVVTHLPDGYVETMNWGMISYEIPIEQYPDTYNGQPLGVVAIASQKRHVAIYLHGVYASPELDQRLHDAYSRAGTKLDMGKSCLRIARLDDLETEVVAEVIAALPPERFVEVYEAARTR